MKSTVMRWLLPVLVFCLLPVADSAGQGTTASITGTVVDENEDVLPGVNVVAVHQPTGTRYGTATNTNGRFSIQGMRVGGPYTISVSFVGYQTIRREGIQLQLNQTRELNFALEPKTAQMEEVEVICNQAGAAIDTPPTGRVTHVSSPQTDDVHSLSRRPATYTRHLLQSAGRWPLTVT